MKEYKKPKSIIPQNEEARLEHLRRYEILDTPPETAFERISQLAALIFDVPVAQVTFVDEARVFYKSNISPLDVSEIPREISFCSLAILEKDSTVFEDMSQIPDLQDNPFVSINGAKFYAGSPIRTHDGYAIGNVCVIDMIPRKPTEKQLKMLKLLSDMVIDELEMRLCGKKAVKVQTDVMNILAHDIKNPLNTIMLTSQLMATKNNENPEIKIGTTRIYNSSEEIQKRLVNFLNISKIESGNIELKNEVCLFSELIYNLKSNFELQAQNKNQTIIYNTFFKGKIKADKALIQDVFENLLGNAIKYSPLNSTIEVNTTEQENSITIEFKDYGQGLTEEDKSKLFVRYAKLSATPTAKERSTGLGLSIVKMLVELHDGEVWAESEGKNKGASFFVKLKK